MYTPKAYIFDYGGTLDTGGCHWGKVLWHAYQRCRVPVSESQFRLAYVYAERMLGRQSIIGPDFTFRQTLQAKLQLQMECLSLTGYDAAVLSEAYAVASHHTAHSREVLQQMAEQYPLVLVSNFYGNIGVVLREFGLSHLFRQVIESALVGIRKPDPRIFSLGVKTLQLPPCEVMVVGDSVSKDIVPARQAGCQTTWLRGEQWTDEPVDVSSADRIIDDLSELTITNH